MLLFVTLPLAFIDMPWGLAFGTIFFALLTVAACPEARTQWEYLGKMAAPETLCLLTPAPQDDDLPPPWGALADTVKQCARAPRSWCKTKRTGTYTSESV